MGCCRPRRRSSRSGVPGGSRHTVIDTAFAGQIPHARSSVVVRRARRSIRGTVVGILSFVFMFAIVFVVLRWRRSR